jgi:hypothetical protein
MVGFGPSKLALLLITGLRCSDIATALASAAAPTMHHVMQVLHCIQWHDAFMILHFIKCTVV